MVQVIGQAQNWCRVLKRSSEVLSLVRRSAKVVQSQCRMQQRQCRGGGAVVQRCRCAEEVQNR